MSSWVCGLCVGMVAGRLWVCVLAITRMLQACCPAAQPPLLPLPAGKLITWTKGFTCEGVIGKDPVQLLEQALKRAGRPCRVGAAPE